MKLLKCKLCKGECEFVSAGNRKILCLSCGYNNINDSDKKSPEVTIIRRRVVDDTNQ